MAAPVLASAAKKLATRLVVRKAAGSRKTRNLIVVVAILGLVSPVILLMGFSSMMMAMFGGAAGGAAQASTEDCAGLPPAGGDALAPAAGLKGPSARGVVSSPSQLSEEQLLNAKTIVEVGQRLRVPEYGWVIALATAMQESTLRNLDYGDRDSLGLFQQRANWGSVAERTDPVTSSQFFYNGGSAADGVSEAGLLDIPDWQTMSVAEAAQAVQISAFPSAYAKWEPLARALVEQLGGGVVPGGGCGYPPPGLQCPPTPWPDRAEGLSPDALLVLNCTYQQFPQFKTFYTIGQRPSGGDGDHANGRAVDAMLPYGNYKSAEAKAFGWKVANWARSNADRLGVKYIIFDAKIWSVARNPEGWRPYKHYTGCTTDTCLHYDHVHISVFGNAASLPATGEWVLPVPPASYHLTARFGQCGGNWSNCHTGLDFAAPIGTPVRSAAQGKVVFAGWNGSYGNAIKVDHGNGVVTTYSHLSSFSQGVLGKTVIPGQTIAAVGSTGNSTGPHLHFEVRRDGTPVDPEQWLKDHGVTP